MVKLTKKKIDQKMPLYALYEFISDMWVVAVNEEGASFIEVIKVSNYK
jgi:hypothetical protein